MEELKKIIKKASENLFGFDIEPELTRPEEQFGDYSTNVAMQLAAQLSKNEPSLKLRPTSPREIADQLAAIYQDCPDISKVEVAGPGFINFWLSDQALAALLGAEPAKKLTGQKIVIETNNPNPFKDMHIGHGFNSIIADTIANLLEAGGAEVHRVSYHGDVGLHVGKSLWAIFDELGEQAGEEIKKISPQEFPAKMREWYARGAGMYEEEPSVAPAIEQYAKQSFAPKGVVKEVYDYAKEQSFIYFDSVFRRLGSKPVQKRYLESQTDQVGRKVVEQNTGKIFEHSNGAVIFPGEKYGLHTRVFITKRGDTLYEARDLGLIQLKHQDYQPDLSVIVTAVEQKHYFEVVFRAADLSIPSLAGKTQNIPTGTVKLSTGKMSSRRGTVVTIEWLFDQVEAAVRKLSDNEETIATASLAAIRYAMLKNRLDSDTIFDIKESVSLDGNTGPYLQYTYVRAQSILKKSTVDSRQSTAKEFELAERSLARKIGEYPEVVEKAVNELMPHHIATYLYELAQTFNRFYETNRVVGDPRESLRLQLVRSYANVLKNGLELLNIPAPEKM